MRKRIHLIGLALVAAVVLVVPASASAVNILLDGGFEAGASGDSPNWTEADSQFGTPLCTDGACGTGAGASPPRTGAVWAWFGGSDAAPHTGSLEQAVVIPNGTATLNYYLRVGTVSTPLDATLKVRVDGAVQQTITEPAVAEGAYTLRSVNLNAFANGASHTVRFEYSNTSVSAAQSFVVDDVTLDSVPPDTDGDGVPDSSDNCPTVANAGQLNTDGDSQGDACDPDDDNDTVPDGSDNCPVNANPSQLNTDGDSQGDACDPDDDNDGVPDSSDNCSTVANADQADLDGDFQGNACDADDDGDGVPDSSDGCPAAVGPAPGGCPVVTPADADGDGVPDASDTCPSVGGATANGCPDVPGTLTLKYSAEAEKFKGKLGPENACAVSREVQVFRKKKGPDPEVGSATTSSSGKYALKKKAAPGKYYASAAVSTLATTGNCLAATSKSRTVE